MTDETRRKRSRTRAPAFATDRVSREPSDAKHRVKAAALMLFSERGFSDVSVRDIMQACGLTSGALYAHYKAKEEVLYSLIREGHERLQRRLEILFELDGDAAQRLARLSYVHMLYQLKNKALARVAYNEYRYLPETMKAEINKVRSRMTDYFDSTIQRGIADRQFDVTALVPTRMFILAGANVAPHWYDASRGESAECIAAWHANMVLRIIMANGPTTAGVRAVVQSALQVMEGGWENLQQDVEIGELSGGC
jgi:AcrR family transcriptional regulator